MIAIVVAVVFRSSSRQTTSRLPEATSAREQVSVLSRCVCCLVYSNVCLGFDFQSDSFLAFNLSVLTRAKLAPKISFATEYHLSCSLTIVVSCFREFYYIQMEKYARQAIADGVTNADDIHVTTDSELYRVLNLHYNRNNQLEVPEGFRLTVQVRTIFNLPPTPFPPNTTRRFLNSIYK